MDFIQWNDNYKVGNKIVDFDHITLVNITNDLFMRVERGAKGAEIASVIHHLIDYVERHFDREEELFLNSAYPDKEKHLNMHNDIRKTVKDIAKVYQSNPDAINIRQVLDFLKKWLTNHIMRADQGYVEYLEA